MEKLDILKKKMIDARNEYKTFIENNSTPSINSEKLNERLISAVGESETQVGAKTFSITKENINEFRTLKQNMEDSYLAFVKEFRLING